MAKFKELLKEAVGGVVSTPAINSGHGSTSQRSGDSRVDTGGKFTFDASELPGSNQGGGQKQSDFSQSDFSSKGNPREAFEDTSGPSTMVLHEDDGGSVTLRDHGAGNYDVVVRAGSQEKVFELDEGAAKEVTEFFN